MNPLDFFNPEELRSIHRAFTSTGGCDTRWAILARTGATDDQLVSFLKQEMGNGGSYGPPPRIDVTFNGSPPRIWLYTMDPKQRPSLSGQRLLSVARAIFGVGYPPTQPSLFDS